jgi:hypothetical protein
VGSTYPAEHICDLCHIDVRSAVGTRRGQMTLVARWPAVYPGGAGWSVPACGYAPTPKMAHELSAFAREQEAAMLTKLAAILAALTLSMIGIAPAAASGESNAPQDTKTPSTAPHQRLVYNCAITQTFTPCHPSVVVAAGYSLFVWVASNSEVAPGALIWVCDYEHRNNQPPNGACASTTKGGIALVGTNLAGSPQRILLYVRADGTRFPDRVKGEFWTSRG